MTTTPKSPIQISARLNVDDRSVLARSTDTVANSTNRMDQRICLVTIDLAPDAPDINIDDVGIGIEVEIPDVLQQHCARHHPPFVASQIFEKLKLAWQQLDLLTAAANAARYEIHFKIADAQHRLLDDRGASPGQRVDPRQHFRKGERL